MKRKGLTGHQKGVIDIGDMLRTFAVLAAVALLHKIKGSDRLIHPQPRAGIQDKCEHRVLREQTLLELPADLPRSALSHQVADACIECNGYPGKHFRLGKGLIHFPGTDRLLRCIEDF